MIKIITSDGKEFLVNEIGDDISKTAMAHERKIKLEAEKKRLEEEKRNEKEMSLLYEIERLRTALNKKVKEYSEITNKYPVFYGMNNKIGKIDFFSKSNVKDVSKMVFDLLV